MSNDPRHYRELVDLLFDGVYFMTRKRQVTYWNSGAEQITGYAADEVVGSRCSDNILIHVDQEGKSLCRTDRCPAVAVMQRGEQLETTIYCHHKQGHRLPIKTRVLPMRDHDGSIIGAMEIFRDVSPLRAMQQQVKAMERLALLDPLTGIGNRRYLEHHLRGRLDEQSRYGWPFGVLFCDIDKFKAVNDNFGHGVGDDVIRMVARTLAACIRPSDFVGRWGGEEFMGIATQVAGWQLMAVAERLRALVEQSLVQSEEHQVRVTISIGATLARQDDDQHSLLERVDDLLYRAKSKGGNCVVEG